MLLRSRSRPRIKPRALTRPGIGPIGKDSQKEERVKYSLCELNGQALTELRRLVGVDGAVCIITSFCGIGSAFFFLYCSQQGFLCVDG